MNFFLTSLVQKIFALVATTIVFLLVLLCAGIPSVESSTLMNGTQSGKSLIFIFGMGIISLFAIVLFWLKDFRSFNLSIIDLLLFTFIVYILARNNLNELKYNLLFLELIGLSLFYIILRFLDRKYYYWIFTGLIAGGLIQAVYGNLQLWGYFSSNHGVFKMTGSFFNPGPYAGYLAAIFPIAFGFYLFDITSPIPENGLIGRYISRLSVFVTRIKTRIDLLKNNSDGKEPEIKKSGQKTTGYYPLKFLPLLALIFIGLVLPASRSRAAWLAVLLSSIYLLSIKYHANIKFIYWFKSKARKVILTISIAVLLSITGAGLYFLKKGSADGRWLIWKISTVMIMDEPITGHGYDGFKHKYMNYQAEYFKKQPDSAESMVAGDSNYAFNEIVQLTIEHGLIVLILIAVIIYFVFISKADKYEIYPKTAVKVFGFNSVNEGLFFTHMVRAVILSIFVFALFSYPMQILPIKLFLVTGLAVFSTTTARKIKLPNGINLNKRINHSTVFARIVFSIGYATFFCWLTFQSLKLKEAFTNWKYGYDLYTYGIYDESISAYEKAYPILKYQGVFLTNYGKALSIAEKHSEAIEVLRQAAQYYPNTIVYTALGNSYKKLNMASKAEQTYLQAWYMNPSRFYPKYLLAKLYDETGQNEKAATTAKELLDKEVKIGSTTIEEIKEEMNSIINKAEAGKLDKNDNSQTKRNFPAIKPSNIEKGAIRSVILTYGFKLQKW